MCTSSANKLSTVADVVQVEGAAATDAAEHTHKKIVDEYHDQRHYDQYCNSREKIANKVKNDEWEQMMFLKDVTLSGFSPVEIYSMATINTITV